MLSLHPVLFSSVSWVLLLSFFLSSGRAQTCYYPNGQVPTDFDFTPCNGNAVSACCAMSEDTCVSHELCFNNDENEYFRGACTDQSWKSASCPQYCLSINPGDYQQIELCDTTHYCCNTGGTSCCNDPSNIQAFNTTVTTGTATATPSATTTTPTPTPSQTASSSSSSKLSTGDIVGIVAAVCAVLGLVISLWSDRIRKYLRNLFCAVFCCQDIIEAIRGHL